MSIYKILTITFFLFIGLSAWSQQSLGIFHKSSSELLDQYQLSSNQEQMILDIQNQLEDQLNTIEHIRNTDAEKYRKKRRSIYYGAEGSFKLILNQNQKETYQKQLAERRKEIATELKKLKETGADEQDILDLQFGISN